MAATRFHERGHHGAPTEERTSHLCLVPADARRRRAPAVYRWRRVAALVAVTGALTLVTAAGAALAPGAGGGVGAAGGAVLDASGFDEATVVGAGPLLGAGTVDEAGAASTHIVQAGDSYWSIAQRRGGGGDVREAVDAIAAANGGRALQVGDRLVLPG